MPKIRGVKPELWTDENFVELSAYARLLWIGLWNHACDNGHLQDKSKQIKMRVLPTDDVNCADLLREIEAQKLIERTDGWIVIPNLTHHQKPHKRWFVTCDMPGCERPEGTSYGFEKAKSTPESTVDQPLSNGGSTGDNGCSTADGDGDGDVEGDGDGELMVTNPLPDKSGRKDAKPPRFDEFWDAYGKKTGKPAALRAYKRAVKKSGVTEALLIASAAEYVAWKKSEGKFPDYTKDPSSWLNGEHWADERPARVAPPTRTEQHLALVRKLAAEEADAQVLPLREIGDGR